MGLVKINSDAVQGEAGTGFRDVKQPLNCSTCHHFVNGNACNGQSMKKLSKQPKHPDGNVKVGAGDYCVYHERKHVGGIAGALAGSRK